jgi:hypothetical protein
MQKSRFYILHHFFGLFLLVFSSCINEIEFDDAQMNPVMVVNCLATPDSIVKVSLSKTKFFLSPASGYETVTDYTVKLWLNGKYKEQLLVKNNQYQSKYKPKPGDILSLNVYKQDSTHQFYQAFTTIPGRTSVIRADTTSALTSESYLVNDSAISSTGKLYSDTLAKVQARKISYAVQFKDSAGLRNFYRIKIFIYHSWADGTLTRETLRVRPDDPIFDRKNESDLFDNDWSKVFNIFTDEQIDGKTYTVRLYGNLNRIDIRPGKKVFLQAAGHRFPVKSELVIDLMGIDESLFNYLKTIKYNNTDLQYFSEPVQIYTNISSGTGIFGSYSHSYFKIALPLTAQNYYFR